MQSKSQQIGLISNLLDQVNGLDAETKDRIDLEAEIEDWNTIDQDLAVEKTNYCGYCGFESDDDELIT